MNPSAGNKIYKGVEVPINEKIYLSPLGREFRLSGKSEKGVKIRYIDNGEFKTISQNQFKKIVNKG